MLHNHIRIHRPTRYARFAQSTGRAILLVDIRRTLSHLAVAVFGQIALVVGVTAYVVLGSQLD